ncbi:GH11402 [Drosophila grimshawi]|uniref:GH11402 n=1 Tax=Drosophila grimshawi TaxID=7222 RepID=B4K3R7_DROGR|nr:GH11402 [Drosophila grimshawi]
MEHISSGTESTDVDATTISESNELAAPPTQITSIDGFFNRKRGRPPKNRFVEVYKSVSKTISLSLSLSLTFSLSLNVQSELSKFISTLCTVLKL